MQLILQLPSSRMHEYATSQIKTYWPNGGFTTEDDFVEHIYRATMLTTKQEVSITKHLWTYTISTPRHSTFLIVQNFWYKTNEARQVLELMDKDYSYQDALQYTLQKNPYCSRETLEIELSKFV